MSSPAGTILIVVAPSGAGKTSLVRALMEARNQIRHSVSFTTRAPRLGERNGEDYCFISEADFRKCRIAGEFLEWAEVHGNLYGTSRRWIDEQTAAGADIVAPSDMMDGRVAAVRAALDAAGYTQTAIMSYAAKYASAFYGPFREAVACTPAFGDRRSHQMDPANAREAMVEIATDLEEGADIVIVKPALPYLDVIRMARDRFDAPVIAYNVSGEYAMLKAAGSLGWIDERRTTLEVLTSIKRAGAGRIITYHAKEAARWLREDAIAVPHRVGVAREWDVAGGDR